jgi:hypothetical protein
MRTSNRPNIPVSLWRRGRINAGRKVRAACIGLYSVGFFSSIFSPVQAQNAEINRRVLVFVPAYEGSALYDPGLAEAGGKAPCVWGSVDAIRRQDYYWALRMPNRLEAGPMLRAGPMDVYGACVQAISRRSEVVPEYRPFTLDRDLFYFSYDWRQDMATATAPDLGKALERYAQQHALLTGEPAGETRFIIIAHSMGGLVVRTLLSQQPKLAEKIDRLYLVGTPNLGAIKAIKTLLVGPGGLRDNALGFPFSLVKLLPNDVNAETSKLVAITRPSLYELLPLQDPQWQVTDEEGRTTRVPLENLLKVETWARYWPSAALERGRFLEPWRARYMGPGDPPDPRAWEFCQDSGFVALQNILSLVRDWRLQLGTLKYTDQLLTRPGESSRMRLVVGTGSTTPTGLISEGAGDHTKVRYTYAPDNDGDETVTKESVLEDFTNPEQIVELKGATHGKLVSDARFLQAFQRDISTLQKIRLPQVDIRPEFLPPELSPDRPGSVTLP